MTGPGSRLRNAPSLNWPEPVSGGPGARRPAPTAAGRPQVARARRPTGTAATAAARAGGGPTGRAAGGAGRHPTSVRSATHRVRRVPPARASWPAVRRLTGVGHDFWLQDADRTWAAVRDLLLADRVR